MADRSSEGGHLRVIGSQALEDFKVLRESQKNITGSSLLCTKPFRLSETPLLYAQPDLQYQSGRKAHRGGMAMAPRRKIELGIIRGTPPCTNQTLSPVWIVFRPLRSQIPWQRIRRA